MKANPSDLTLALEALAHHMQVVGWWTTEAPSEEALASKKPFCVDCLTFSEWLQWVYIPKMHHYIKLEKKLPNNSGLTPIAVESWKGCEDKSADLISLMRILDDLSNNENVDSALRSLSRFHPSH